MDFDYMVQFVNEITRTPPQIGKELWQFVMEMKKSHPTWVREITFSDETVHFSFTFFSFYLSETLEKKKLLKPSYIWDKAVMVMTIRDHWFELEKFYK